MTTTVGMRHKAGLKGPDERRSKATAISMTAPAETRAPRAPAAPPDHADDASGTDAEAIFDRVDQFLQAQRLPDATYRIQLNRSFNFHDAQNLVPYLAALGVTDLYLSPYIKAAVGSTHGYDIVDHGMLNPEIGSVEDYDAFVRELHAHNMGQVLDVVPNHMGIATSDNAWWMDVLENGPSSPYASFFDIDWMPLKPDLANKVLLPVLGDQYGKVLEDQQLLLAFEDGAFHVTYGERRFPIAPSSWSMILHHRFEELNRQLGEEHPQLIEYQSILTALGHLPAHTETDPEKVNERRREKEVIKRRIRELCQASSEVNQFVTQNVQAFNGTHGDPRSFDLLDRLLWAQPYRLSHWRVAADEINYRRFFDVNELAAICMESAEVFQKTHHFILRLVADGKINGLRIDHPDGMFDPVEYLRRLQRARFLQLCRELAWGYDTTRHGEELGQPWLCLPANASSELGPAWHDIEQELVGRHQAAQQSAPTSRIAQPLFIVVEKILERGERLPDNWPVHGTTGYDFLNAVNGLFVDRESAKAFDRLYERFLRDRINYKELVYDCKKLIMQASMSSEIGVLGHQLDRISERSRSSRDFTLNGLTDAIREIIACFPVYRTYVEESGVLDRDRRYIEMAVARAKRRNPATSASIFDFVRGILLLKYCDTADAADRQAHLRFVGKFQQMTGPVMAKAVEDTGFYIFNRLVSLNEVGGDPEVFGTSPAAFHQQNRERLARWPNSLLATSTHDNKRSEDVRARINVLSEIPDAWRTRLFRWARSNQRHKAAVDGGLAPSRNDEYLLYQTLIGTWPFEPMDRPAREKYVGRIQQYMLKATREAKVNTSWINPDEHYEQATCRFVAAVLQNSQRNNFLRDFEPFTRQIVDLGIWNSLSQTLLKLTCPGVPDLYQGTELWDLSLVDPDNRRPIDYAERFEKLQSLQAQLDQHKLRDVASELVSNRSDGRIKLFVTLKALEQRRLNCQLLTEGDYVPVETVGSKREHICAFARKTTRHVILVVIPRLVGRLTGFNERLPLGAAVWEDTMLRLPDGLVGPAFRNAFTGELVEPVVTTARAELPVSSILARFPVALLERRETDQNRNHVQGAA